jgi:hypothetical protein
MSFSMWVPAVIGSLVVLLVVFFVWAAIYLHGPDGLRNRGRHL